MRYHIDDLEMHAICPRKYRFCHVDIAPRSVTTLELYGMAHKKACAAYFKGMHKDKPINEDEYYDVWLDEWNSKKGAVDYWWKHTDKRCQARAQIIARKLTTEIYWGKITALDSQKVFSVGNGVDVAADVDCELDDSIGLVSIPYKTDNRDTIVNSYRAAFLQTYGQQTDMLVLSIPLCSRNIKLLRTRLTKYLHLRTVASMHDQIAYMGKFGFPRCHPQTNQCSPVLCGYWRICTGNLPRRLPERMGKLYESKPC